MLNMKHRSGIVVEFFGAPGVGKTYLAKKFVMQCKEAKLNVSNLCVALGERDKGYRIGYKLIIIFLLFIKSRGVFIGVVNLVRCHNVGGMAAFRLLVNWLYIVGLTRRELNRHNIVVLDQGFTQLLWSVAFRGGQVDSSNEIYKNIMELVGLKELLVINVRLNSKEHYKRLSSRTNGASPLDDAGLKVFDQGRLTAQLVGEMLCKNLNVEGCSNLYSLNIENNKDEGYLFKEFVETFGLV